MAPQQPAALKTCIFGIFMAIAKIVSIIGWKYSRLQILQMRQSYLHLHSEGFISVKNCERKCKRNDTY